MVSFRDIINNPNFGKRYRTDSTVKRMSDLLLANLYPQVKMHISDANDIKFSYGPAGKMLMDFDEAVNFSTFNNTLRSTRIYTGGADTSYVGNSTNTIANWVASQGYTTKVSTHRFQDSSDLEEFWRKYRSGSGKDTKLMGLPVPRGDKGVNLFEVYKGDKQLSFDEIAALFKFKTNDSSENIIKRLSLLTSDRELAFMASQQDRLKVHLFDPIQLADRSADIMIVAEDLLKIEHLAGNKDMKLEKIYATMSDGENFMSQASANRLIAQVRTKSEDILKAAEATRPIDTNSEAYRTYLAQKQLGERFREIADEQARNMREGGRFNYRLMNGIDQNGKTVQLLKGDIGVKSDAEIKRLLPHLTQDDINRIDVFSSAADVKNELVAEAFSFQTFESHGMPGQAYSNSLSLGTHQELLDVNHHIMNGTNTEIEQHIADIKSGHISEGFRNILKEMSQVDLDEFDSLADQKIAMEGKSFARRISKMLDSGINISDNEYITNQLFSAMKKHYTTLRKVHDKDKNIITVGGVEYPNYRMRLPVQGSVVAHVTGSTDVTALQGMIQITPGVHKMHKIDIFKSYGAFGGFDLDDSLVTALQYDSTAKRLLALTIREPNEAGEYMFFDADVTGYNKIPKEIRNIFRKHKELGIEIAQSQKSPKQKSKMIRERDALGKQLHEYFMSNKDIAKINLAETFADQVGRPNHLPMPKGFARSASAMAEYQSGPGLRSFMSSREISGSNKSRTFASKLKKEFLREGTVDAGSLPFRYVGQGVSEWHQKYFTELKRSVSSTTMPLQQRIAERIEQELASKGSLGQASNLTGVIDEFMRSNLRGLPTPLANELHAILSEKKFQHIDKELVIDTMKKTGSSAIIEDVLKAMSSNAEEFGSLIARMQQKTLELGIKESIGIDPVVFAQRIGNNKSFQEGILRGYNSVSKTQLDDIGKLALSNTDPKAYIARLHKGISDLEISLSDSESEIAETARLNRLKSLEGIDFSSKELTRASEFISHMTEVKSDLDDLFNLADTDTGLAKLKGILDSGINIDDLNTAAIRKLYSFGLFEKGKVGGETKLIPTKGLDTQLLAISKLLSENKGSLSMLMSVGANDASSISNLLNIAEQRLIHGPKALAEIRGMTDVSSEIGKFIAPNERGVLEFTDLAKGVYDPAERGLAILSKIANDPAKDTLNKYKHFIVDDLKSSGQIDLNTIGSERRIPFRLRQNFVNDITPGTGRYSLRSAADEVAGEVSAMGREYMTRLDKDLIKRLWQEPVTRKGIIGLGIFAGIGVIHRLTHNPTPEEVGGPPLLPGGSPYEDYDNINYSAVSSMYPSSANFSSGGMQYTVNTSSGYDPQKLSTNLSAITTGSSSTTIYKSRRTVGKRAHSSKDILNSRNSSI